MFWPTLTHYGWAVSIRTAGQFVALQVDSFHHNGWRYWVRIRRDLSLLDIAMLLAVVLSLVVAFIANGGKAGNDIVLKISTLGSLLAIWVHLFVFLCLFLFMNFGVSYIEDVFSLNLINLALLLQREFWTIYLVAFPIVFLPLLWHYFSRFRPANPSMQ